MGVRAKGRQLKRRAEDARQALEKIPGPSTNPATNLLILDVAIRGVSLIAGRLIEKGALRARYRPQKASDIVKGRTFLEAIAATGAARIATRSVPGFLLVTGGLLAKTAFDRSQSLRKARREGERQLAEQAERADSE